VEGIEREGEDEGMGKGEKGKGEEGGEMGG